MELAGDQFGAHINVPVLAALPVPLPDHDMEAAMAAVHHALNRADEWRQEASDPDMTKTSEHSRQTHLGYIPPDSWPGTVN